MTKPLIKNWRALFVAATFMLTGCATSKVHVIPTVGDDFQLSARQGAVTAQVINATPYPKTFNYITLAPKDVFEAKENKFERLQAVEELDGKTTAFAAPVPAGEYSLSDIFSLHYFGNYYYRKRQDADPSFGTFKVEAGKVTDLGALIYYYKPDGDRYIPILTRRDGMEDAFELLQNKAAPLARQLKSKDRLTWDEDDYGGDRQALYLNIVQNPIMYNSAYPQRNGGWIFATSLGVLLKRSPDGDWAIDALETDYGLKLYQRRDDGAVVVVDEKNNIYFRRAKEKAWRLMPAPRGQEKLSYLQLGDKNELYALQATERQLNLYQGKLSPSTGWSRTLTYTPEYGWLSPDELKRREEEQAATEKPKSKQERKPKTIDSHQIIYHNGETLAAVDGILYRLDLANAQAKVVPLKIKVNELRQNAYNQLLASSNPSLWDGNIKTYYSLNSGKNWHTYSNRFDACPDEERGKGDKCAVSKRQRKYWRRKHATDPVFFEDGTAYSIMSKVDAGFGEPSTTTYYMVVSKDAGETWQELKEANLPKYCGQLFKGENDNTLLLSCRYSNGYFYRASKDNVKWELEHQPALF